MKSVNENSDIDPATESGSDGSENTSVGSESPPPESSDDRRHRFEVLSTNQIAHKMDDDIKEINKVINPPLLKTTAMTILDHFKWDKVRFLEQYFDDKEKVFKEANLAMPKPANETRKNDTRKRLRSEDKILCEICFTKQPKPENTWLEECGHVYCNECWKAYLNCKVSEGACSKIFCPTPSCNCLVDGLTVGRLLDKRAYEKYTRLVLSKYVTSNRLMKWCPAPDCPNAILAEFLEAMPIVCNCGKIFCFKCSESWHAPATCNMLRKWNKKCLDDSENANWIMANTKCCPKCDSCIEKNGGCSHMTCCKCGHEFCWICSKKWSRHGEDGYDCNKYNENEESKKNQAKSALQRYLFHYERYNNHALSLKLQDKLRKNVNRIVNYMTEMASLGFAESKLFEKAITTLNECRKVLMYTYIFAFYVKKNNHLEIFENNQRDLEIMVEKLCAHLEHEDYGCDSDIDSDTIRTSDTDYIKLRVQDLTRYCDRRKQVLIDHVNEGTNKGTYWVFNEAGCD